MDKKAFLAILLSLIVLSVYSSMLKKPQPLEQKEVTSQILRSDALPEGGFQLQGRDVSSSQPTSALIIDQPQTGLSASEYTMETDKYELVFSNMGGNLKEIYLKDYDVNIMGSNFLAVEEFNNLPFVFKEYPNRAVFVYEGQDEKIEKTFFLSPESYLIEWELIITNLTSIKKESNFHILGSSIDLSKLGKTSGGHRNMQLSEFSISLPDKVLRKNVHSFKKKTGLYNQVQAEWLGIRDQYFCIVMKPNEVIRAYFTEKDENNVSKAGIISNFLIQGNSSYMMKADLYAGPQDSNILKSYNIGIEKIVSFGMFTPIARLITWLLKTMHKIIPSWGFCIILISCLISIVLYPFTLKSLTSMKEMQALQPEMERLRTAYKDQPQKLNKAIMELYKEHKINPLGGCLPMFLQFPVFISLYLSLQRSLELRSASFLWIQDLSQPDKLFTLSRSFPIIGNEINLLPMLMLGAMFVQQKISSQGNLSSSPEQQKMMMFLMPILFGFMFYHFPSGLTLYWTCYTIISIMVQRKLLHPKKA